MSNVKFSTFFKRHWLGFLFFILLIIFALIAPFLFTRPSEVDCLVFDDHTGWIGDTIGGTMGPFIAIAAALLTFMAFWVQYVANEDLKKRNHPVNPVFLIW